MGIYSSNHFNIVKSQAIKISKCSNTKTIQSTQIADGGCLHCHIEPHPKLHASGFSRATSEKEVFQTNKHTPSTTFFGIHQKVTQKVTPQINKSANLSEIIKPSTNPSTHKTPPMAFGMKMVSLGPILTTLKRFQFP